jgi:hypothetical protein
MDGDQLKDRATLLLREFRNLVLQLSQVAQTSDCYYGLKTTLDKRSSEPLERALARIYIRIETQFEVAQRLLTENLFLEVKEQLKSIKEWLFVYREAVKDAMNVLDGCSSSSSEETLSSTVGSVFSMFFGRANQSTPLFPDKKDEREIQKQLQEAFQRQERRNVEAAKEREQSARYEKELREKTHEQAERFKKEYERNKRESEAEKEKQARYEKEQRDKKLKEEAERYKRELDAEKEKQARYEREQKEKNKTEGNDACFSIREGFIPEKSCYAKYLDALQATSVNERDITNCKEKDNTVREIQKAYKKQSVKAHPDKSGSNELFQRVGLAYNLLMETIDRLCNGFSGGSTQPKRTLRKKRSKSKSKSPTRKRSPVRTKKANVRVLNPKTGRYVLRGGRIGSQIIADLERSQ